MSDDLTIPQRSSVEQRIEELRSRLEAAPPTNLFTDIRGLFGGPETQVNVLRAIQQQAPLIDLELKAGSSKRADARAQTLADAEARKAEAEQMKTTKGFIDLSVKMLDGFWKMSQAAQAEAGPLMEQFLQLSNERFRLGVDPKHIKQGFTERDFAKNAAAMFDPILPDDEKKYFQERIRMTPPEKHGDVVKEAAERANFHAQRKVPEILPLLALKAGASKETPRDAKELLDIFVKEYPELSQGALRAAGLAFLADDKNAGLLDQYGIRPPKVTLGAAEEGARKREGLKPDIVAGEAERARQIALREQDTPQGRATLAATEASTAKTRQDTALGKVVPFQEGGGVASVKPGGMEVLQPPGPRPPGERTRGAIAGLESLSGEATALLDRARKTAPDLFGRVTQAASAAKRVGEQIGFGTANADYEAFWSDMDFTRAKYIKAMEEGNISRTDMEFFLSSWPERSTAPTVAVENLRAAVRFADNKLAGLQKEFRPAKRRRYNPATDRIE